MKMSDNICEAIKNQKNSVFKGPDGVFIYVVDNDHFKPTMERMLKVKNLKDRDRVASIAKNTSDTFTHDQADWVEWFFSEEFSDVVEYKPHCHLIIFKDGMWTWLPLFAGLASVYPFREDGTYCEGYDSDKDYWQSIELSGMVMEDTVWATYDGDGFNIIGFRKGYNFDIDISPLFKPVGQNLPGAYHLEREWAKKNTFLKDQKDKTYDNWVAMWTPEL